MPLQGCTSSPEWREVATNAIYNRKTGAAMEDERNGTVDYSGAGSGHLGFWGLDSLCLLGRTDPGDGGSDGPGDLECRLIGALFGA